VREAVAAVAGDFDVHHRFACRQVLDVFARQARQRQRVGGLKHVETAGQKITQP